MRIAWWLSPSLISIVETRHFLVHLHHAEARTSTALPSSIFHFWPWFVKRWRKNNKQTRHLKTWFSSGKNKKTHACKHHNLDCSKGLWHPQGDRSKQNARQIQRSWNSSLCQSALKSWISAKCTSFSQQACHSPLSGCSLKGSVSVVLFVTGESRCWSKKNALQEAKELSYL